LRTNSTSALKAAREERANRTNWVLWATVVMRIRSNDRSSCAVLSMFICEITSSSLRLGGDSLRQAVRESPYGLFAEHRERGVHSTSWIPMSRICARKASPSASPLRKRTSKFDCNGPMECSERSFMRRPEYRPRTLFPLRSDGFYLLCVLGFPPALYAGIKTPLQLGGFLYPRERRNTRLDHQTDPGLTGARGLIATIPESNAENRGQFALNRDALSRVRMDKLKIRGMKGNASN
jgi:hypothetical protein